MSHKINVGLVFGGNSSEHDVSERSALNIYEAMDKSKYNIYLFLMTKDGIFLTPQQSKDILYGKVSEQKLADQAKAKLDQNNPLARIINLTKAPHIDVFFPIIHGNLGEDGTIQSLFRLMNVAYVGSGILGSALAFDKDATKQILTHHHIRNTKYVLLTPNNYKQWSYERLAKQVGNKIIFIKPARQGSSVGIHQVQSQAQLIHGLKDAFQYDYKVLAEEAIKGPKEVEISVMGNEHPVASKPGAITVPKQDKFYTYQNKFVDPKGVHFEIPAKIPQKLSNEITQMALKSYKALELKGMARLDFLVSKSGKAYVGEANTLPGFTNISLFPQLWKAQGISTTKLIDKLIKLAFQNFHRESKLHHSFVPLKIKKIDNKNTATLTKNEK